MTTREQLKSRLNDSPYLVIDVASGESRLDSSPNVLRKMGDKMFFIMDLEGALRGLENLTGKDEFTIQDIAEAAGISYQGAYAWLMRGTLRPSVREPEGAGKGKGPRYSFADLFAAGVMGTLKRNGLSLQVLKSIGPLLNEETPVKTGKK